MSSFTENTSIQPLPRVNRWITTNSFRYYIGEENSEDYVDVPKGFIFDGASVPRVFGIIIQKVEPKTISAACVHDYLYVKKIRPRLEADRIFKEALIVGGTSKLKAWTMYLAVVLFGWIVWYRPLLRNRWKENRH